MTESWFSFIPRVEGAGYSLRVAVTTVDAEGEGARTSPHVTTAKVTSS